MRTILSGIVGEARVFRRTRFGVTCFIVRSNLDDGYTRNSVKQCAAKRIDFERDQIKPDSRLLVQPESLILAQNERWRQA